MTSEPVEKEDSQLMFSLPFYPDLFHLFFREWTRESGYKRSDAHHAENNKLTLLLKCYDDQKIISYFPSDFESVFA